MFRRKVALALTRTTRIVDPEDADNRLDVTSTEYHYITPPHSFYESLKNSDGTRKAWDVLSAIDVRQETSENVGLLSWQMDMSPGGVPGRLEIQYLDELGAEVRVDTFDLVGGSESTGDLEVVIHDATADPPAPPEVASARWMFFPEHLTTLSFAS